MATLSNPQYYKSGVSGQNAVVGFESSSNRVVRYTLTLAAGESADHIKFKVTESSTNHIAWGRKDGGQDEINKKCSLYFAITTDPNEFANAGYGDISRATGKVTMEEIGGYWVEDNVSFAANGEADIYLYPGVTYYLWIFPGFSNLAGGNSTWGWFSWGKYLDTSVILSGSAGIVNIGGQKYIPMVYTGGKWVRCLPYISANGQWKVCGGG